MSFTVSIIGRPNVGKSTFFNRLVGKKESIVHNTPGVTRDRKEQKVKFVDIEFTLIDTAGFESDSKILLNNKTNNQIITAITESDLLLFVVDFKSGIVASDHEFSHWIRKQGKDVILVVNKCDNKNSNILESDLYKMGYNDYVSISAEHKSGFADLYNAIIPYYDKYQEAFSPNDENGKGKFIEIAIIGKPNVGKSTLINALINQERVITSNEVGTTRDSIAIEWEFDDKKIRLIDTAGIRKKANITDSIEKLTLSSSFKAIRFAEICILVLDVSNKGLDKQDITIANHVVHEGRGLIIVLNKWDLVPNHCKKALLEEFKLQITQHVPQVKNCELVTISALKKDNIAAVINKAIISYDLWNQYISTGKLNKWLMLAVSQHRPALYRGKKEVKIRYITQVKSRPPTFMINVNYPDALDDSYIRYLKNSLQEYFSLKGVVIRFLLNKNKNPYNSKQDKKRVRKIR